MIEYRQTETARTAVENLEFAVGMLQGANMLSDSQRDCLVASVKMLRHLVAGAEQMQLNVECGGDGWWDGWKAIEETLADRPEVERFPLCAVCRVQLTSRDELTENRVMDFTGEIEAIELMHKRCAD